MRSDKVVAIVASVDTKGKHGPYAMCFDESGVIQSPITFSLLSPTWREDDQPEGGTKVVLSKLRRKKAGWRALEARYLGPQDEAAEDSPVTQPATSHKED